MAWVGAGDGLVVTKLHESLQSIGDPQDTKEQNPLRISLSLYRYCFAKPSNLWLII